MSFVPPTIFNEDPQGIQKTVADMEVCDCFLHDGGKVYEKVDTNLTLCHINGVRNAPAEFGPELKTVYRNTKFGIATKTA